MFKNHLKIAWRSLKTNPLFSVINILGLSLGLAITIVLFIFVRHERSFDSMYAQKENIFRVLIHTEGENGQETWASAPPALAPTAMSDIPEVKSAARMLKNDFGGTASVRANDENFTENSFFWVDNELIDIFDIKFIQGKPEGALNRPNTIALSESTAKRYFGNQDPLGKIIKVDGRYDLEVTGVYENFPSNSTLDCNVMASLNTLKWVTDVPSWYNVSFETFCLVGPNATAASATVKMMSLHDENVDKEYRWYTFGLQPLEKVHLYSADFSNSYASHVGDISEVRNLSYLAILIVLIACINYMNLTTARSQKRSKEVGINKTLGASVGSLITRFYIETGLITLLSMILGVLTALLALPLFNAVAGQNLDTSLLFNFEFLIAFAIIWVATTVISGLYPAFYLSGFSPKAVLQGAQGKGKSNGNIRKGLVVFQFAASVVLIVGILVIYQQIRFMQQQKLGFEPENVIAISTTGIRGSENTDALVQEFKRLTNVSSVAMAQGFPGMDVSGRVLRRSDDDQDGLNIQTNVSDAGIIDALGLSLLAGTTLPEVKQEGDTLVQVVLNKKAIDYLGYSPEEAIGKKVEIGAMNTIVGVVDDFNFESLRVPIGAYAFHNNTGEPKSYLLVRFNSNELASTVQQFENAYKNVAPESAFDYSFLDQDLAKLYEREQRASRVGILFCGLAIFVACLGLFGLAAFMAEQRKKEIGVRKVLGASVLNITRMLSKDFIKLVLLSLIIAFPIAFWLAERWLQDFAYRVDIGWTVFVIAGLSALLIALFTVSFQSIRAAMTDPVKSLRAE